MDKRQVLEKLYERMVVDVPDFAIFLLDLDGTVLSWNAGVEKIQGYREYEIIGQNFSIFYLPEDRQYGLPERLLKQAIADGNARHIGRRVRRDGSLFWGSIHITALCDNGEVIGFTNVTRELREEEKS